MNDQAEALIHDLAIVLGGCLHPSAQIGPAPRLAADRISDALGITPGDLVADIENRLTAALIMFRAQLFVHATGPAQARGGEER
jgi:hypothetical protein